MRIEIDDSGGSSVFGGFIVLLTNGKNDYWEEVDIKLFQILDKTLRNDEIAREVESITRRGLKALNISKTDEIHICKSGYLKGARKCLQERGYRFIPDKIIGRTQELVEKRFADLLRTKYRIDRYYCEEYWKNEGYQLKILKQRKDFRNAKTFFAPVRKLMQALGA